MSGNAESDLVKWLLCRLMIRQGYSETDVAKHMEKIEAFSCAPPILGDMVQDVEELEPMSVEFLGTP